MRGLSWKILGAALLAAPLIAAAPVAVQAPVAVPTPAPHDRLLPLQGGRNFRDLGGYRTADGRTVKWGLLFRSGSMHGLTPADYTYLERRGIRVVCDFRDRGERAKEPVSWPADGAPQVLSEDYVLDRSFLPKGAPKDWTAEQAREGLASSYPHMLVQFNGQYRRIFGELLAGRAPLAFNCSAGKDRTGIAAALLLTALGVPRPTVIEDYLLTNRYLTAASFARKPGAPMGVNPMEGASPEVSKALLAADPSYIRAAFAVIDAHPGGAEGYLKDELGLDRDALAKLRSLYLVRA